MKAKAIKFFSPKENLHEEKPAEKKAPLPAGYVSNSGKLVFPSGILQDLGIDPEEMSFKIGMQEGTRKIKSIFLVPSKSSHQTFSLIKSGRGRVIPLSIILKKGGINFNSEKFVFTISTFDYEDAISYELIFESEAPKPVYTGKRRGRKPLSKSA